MATQEMMATRSLKLPRPLDGKFREYARRDGESINGVMRSALREYAARRDAKEVKA